MENKNDHKETQKDVCVLLVCSRGGGALCLSVPRAPLPHNPPMVRGTSLCLKSWFMAVRSASEAACGLTFAVQMNFTVTDRIQMTAVYSNSHH